MKCNFRRLSFALAVFVTLTSCTSLPPPPDYLAVDYLLMSQKEGYVSSVGYFTPKQMADAQWEFRRIKAVQANMCRGYQHFIGREVAWFPTTPVSKDRCARVVYTVVCIPESYFDENPLPPLPDLDAFKAARTSILSERPHSPIKPGCGEKDRGIAHPTKPVPPPAPAA